MAEFAAVGVASCILQVVDFSAKVIKTSYILISASQDALREEIHLSRLVHEQDAISDRLQASLTSRPVLTANETAVVNLSGEVKTETDCMLRILSQFKLASAGQNCFKRSMHSVKTAIKIHSRKQAVEDHRKKLQLVNGQLAVALLSVLRDQNEDNSKNLQKLQQNVDFTRRDIVSLILKSQDELKLCFDKHEDRRQARIWAIINSLRFVDMQSRQDSIRTAFPATCRWALDQDTSGLRTWLRSGSDIYWVSGKAGSGKSTFMKFLSNDRRTNGYLRQWSGTNADLIVVECYFWYLGSALQKSIEGLLRTIVYQILCSCPKTVETILPVRWADAEADQHAPQATWSLEELRNVIRDISSAISRANAKTNVTRTPKCCIFIDGLDEYSGNHLELVRILEVLASNGDTKLCVSSRPWNVFVKAFELQKPHLCLQDLTKSDIKHYVESNLTYALIESASRDPYPSVQVDINLIIVEIVKRAEGVFLWVYLVVESVLRGLGEDDSIATLRQRVQHFPSDLEGFFDIIISRVDTVYQFQTTQALALAYSYADDNDLAAECSSYLDFALLEQSPTGLENPQYLWDRAPQALSAEGFIALVRKTRTFLSACCKDLLVVNIPRDSSAIEACAADPCTVKVQFLHRTVFEYLGTPERQSQLRQLVPKCYKDGSVFHVLNMGKLKYYWAHRPSNLSDYFTRQASFSLDHSWTGLSVAFIDQIHKCQPLHQAPRCVAIGQAYIAFRQFDTFRKQYVAVGCDQQSPLQGLRLRNMTCETESKNPADGYGSIHTRLLTAALGVACCMTFRSEEVDLDILALILRDFSKAQDMSGERVLLEFLKSALPPLAAASIAAHQDSHTWAAFFGSYSVRHMYDIVQLLMRNGPDTIRGLFFDVCPVSEDISYEAVWGYLTQYTPGSVTLPGDTMDQQPAEPRAQEGTDRVGSSISTGISIIGRKRPPQDDEDDEDQFNAATGARDRDFVECSQYSRKAFRGVHPLLTSRSGKPSDYDYVFHGPGRWWSSDVDDR